MNAQKMANQRRRKVLLVDDDEDFLELMGGALRGQHEVITAANGEAALVILAAEAVDLLITDICMPKMSGFELIRAVCARGLPIIAISGYELGQPNYMGERSVLDSPGVSVLRKPCTVIDVCQAAALRLSTSKA